MLADIPFVRLREGLSEKLQNGSSTYSDAVRVAQERIAPAITMRFSIRQCKAILGGTEVSLQPLPFAILLWLAVRRTHGLPPVRPGVNAPAEELLRIYARVIGRSSADYEKAERALRHEEDFLPYFQEKRTLVNKCILATLGRREATPYLIESTGQRPNTCYTLTLPPEAIVLPKGLSV